MSEAQWRTAYVNPKADVGVVARGTATMASFLCMTSGAGLMFGWGGFIFALGLWLMLALMTEYITLEK